MTGQGEAELLPDNGVGGLQLGYLTPLLVLFFNAVWGLVAAQWLKQSRSS